MNTEYTEARDAAAEFHDDMLNDWGSSDPNRNQDMFTEETFKEGANWAKDYVKRQLIHYNYLVAGVFIASEIVTITIAVIYGR